MLSNPIVEMPPTDFLALPTGNLADNGDRRCLARAELIFDSWAETPARLRGAAPSSRQLAYSTGKMDIALSVLETARHTYAVAGQLFPTTGVADYDVMMVDGHLKPTDEQLRAHATHANTLGEFWLENLPEGSYHLILSQAAGGVLVTPVHLQSSVKEAA